MACKRSLVVLSRNSRPRSTLPASNVLPSSRRQLAVAADNNLLPERDALPPSMALSPQDLTSTEVQSTTGEVGFGRDDIRPPRAVQLAYLKPLKREAKYRIPTCNLHLRSYSARNLEFFTTFALRAAYYLNLPAVGPIPLPKQIKRWTVPKGHFVHKKSQENFERITLSRLIQIQDGHPETVQMWLAYLRKRSYYGVGMKANVWSFEKLGLGREMDITAEEGQSLEQRWTSDFPSQQLTPEVQAEVDQWMEKNAPGEISISSNEHEAAPERRSVSISTRIDDILAQIEQEAVLAEERSTQSSENGQTIEADKAPQTGESPVESASAVKTMLKQEDTVVAEPSQAAAEPSLKEETPAVQEQSSIEDSPVQSAETVSTASASPIKTLSSSPMWKESDQKMVKSTTKRGRKPSVKAAPQAEEEKTPSPSKEDTSKNISTPEEADPAVTPQTEKAKEAEAEDAAQPLGDLPKTPS